jgi:hypothetical protein
MIADITKHTDYQLLICWLIPLPNLVVISALVPSLRSVMVSHSPGIRSILSKSQVPVWEVVAAPLPARRGATSSSSPVSSPFSLAHLQSARSWPVLTGGHGLHPGQLRAKRTWEAVAYGDIVLYRLCPRSDVHMLSMRLSFNSSLQHFRLTQTQLRNLKYTAHT